MTAGKPRVLVLDDDQMWLDQVPDLLGENFEVDSFPTIDQGLQVIQTESYDILLLDLNFLGDHRTGLDLFKQVHALSRGIDILVISAETHPQRLVELFNAGVSQFLAKPARPNEIREKLRQILEDREIRVKTAQQATHALGVTLTGSSQVIRKLRADITRAIASGVRDILLLGASGTGKELVARMLAQGDRSGKFIAVHCGAINDSLAESELFGHVKGAFTGADRDRIGAFEAAGSGFVFLDEIGEMPLNQQAKLLRVLQERRVQRVGSVEERKVSFKCVSATHINLEQAIAEKKFRADLFYRIQGEVIHLPSLRERLEDIPELVYSFIARHPIHQKKSITQEALCLLQEYSWPGNIRELNSTIERLCNRCEDLVIREKDICQVLPDVVGRKSSLPIEGERRRFEKAILDAKGDRNLAAGILGLSRATFFRKAKDLGLVRERRALVS